MSEPLAAIVGRLVRGLPPSDGTADAALLARFVAWRDEAAFELLVYRHGPLVRGVTRRVLRHEQDAEDAFQATFLALAKRAATIRGQSLAGWLYRVAFHAALKARQKRVACPRLCVGMDETNMPTQSRGHATQDELHERETRAMLDAEVMRLPERFRLPVVLCYLQGRSNSEAAAALGVPKGTIDSRLATARQRLRDRLVRRGLAPAVGLAVVDRVIDSAATAADVSGSVARAMAKSAVAFLSNQQVAGVVPTAAAVLAEGVLQTMFVTKLKWAMAAALALAVLGSGAGMATYGGGDDSPKAEQKEPERAKAVAGAKVAERAEEAKKPGPSTALGIRKLLQDPMNLDRPIENAPLKDVLEFLSDKYGITIRIDLPAFARFGVARPTEIEDQQVRLNAGRNLTLNQLLRELLAQVKYSDQPVPVTYAVKGSQVAIVPAFQLPFLHATAITFEDFTPFVNPNVIEEQVQGDPVTVEIQSEPLDRALRDLADATGTNIILDNRANERGQTRVTATLQGVRLFTALKVLSDMAGLQPVVVGNVYYVTTPENADRLQKREWPQPAPPAVKPTTKGSGM
jgi:RNA polymerase sigma factor (sigma-70 family)